MAFYKVKYLDGAEVKSVVLTASDESDAGRAFKSLRQGISANNVISVKNLDQYHRDYGAATYVAKLISFGGWTVLLLGVIGLIFCVPFAFAPIVNMGALDPTQLMLKVLAVAGVGFSFLLVLIGLLMAAAGQHLRATTDVANYSGEMLALMKTSDATPPLEPTTQKPQQVSTAMFCTECGATIVDAGSTFCAHCGVKL